MRELVLIRSQNFTREKRYLLLQPGANLEKKSDVSCSCRALNHKSNNLKTTTQPTQPHSL